MSRPDIPGHDPGQPHDPPASVWTTAQRGPRAQRAGRYLPATTQHPARMLPAIAAHALAVYTRPGQLVLDPMCGAGTSLVEAVHHGRDALGIEYEPRWAALAAANLTHARAHGAPGHGQVLTGDARHLPDLLPPGTHGRITLVLTSPPYGPSVHGQVSPGPGHVRKTHDRYSPDRADRGNLAHHSLDGLLDGFRDILTGCLPLLTPDAHIVITVRPWRRDGHLIDLPAAVLHTAQTIGLRCAERCVALLAGLRDDHLVARPSFFQLLTLRQARARGIPLHLIVHEDVLVLVPD